MVLTAVSFSGVNFSGVNFSRSKEASAISQFVSFKKLSFTITQAISFVDRLEKTVELYLNLPQ